MTVNCTLASGDNRNGLKALVDTGATGYAFIDEETAQIVCYNLGIEPLPLLKPRSLKGFDGNLASTLVTHAIYPNLTVHDHSESTAPMLITKLGSHPIILGKPWMNAHGVMLDMKYDRLVFKLGRCSHFGAPIANPVVPKAPKIPASAPPTTEVPKYRVLKREAVPYPPRSTAATQGSSVKEPSVVKTSPIASKAKEEEEPLNIAVIGAASYLK